MLISFLSNIFASIVLIFSSIENTGYTLHFTFALSVFDKNFT